MADEKTTTGIVDVIAGILKTASIETRKELGRIIRTDANIWNSVNGVGNIEEVLPKGSFEGLVRSGNTLLAGVSVTAQQEGVDIDSVITDANGFYQIQLEGGSYDLIYSLKDYNTEIKDDEHVFPDVEMTKNVELTSAV